MFTMLDPAGQGVQLVGVKVDPAAQVEHEGAFTALLGQFGYTQAAALVDKAAEI